MSLQSSTYEQKEGIVYQQNQYFPTDWISWNTGIGLKDGVRVIFLKIDIFSYRYKPLADELLCAGELTLKIVRNQETEPLIVANTYDLLIITSADFAQNVEPLVEHKISYNVKTLMVTTDEIYSSAYFPAQGRDGAEKVKYFIKDAIEEWGITYVLLFGGMKSHWFGTWGMDGPYLPSRDDLWHIPVRYSSLDDQTEGGYLTDLYFADIYKDVNGTPVFDDWDSNQNDIFGEWSFRGRDYLDLYPDVYVGRMPCRNTKEVDIMVDKIIAYESNPADPSWFNNVCLFGGDTFPVDEYYEGEIETYNAFSYLPSEFNAVTHYASEGTLGGTGPIASRLAQTIVINAINQGCGFIFMSGHAAPECSVTYHPNLSDYYIYMLSIYTMPLLKNGQKLPICVVAGCHNNEYNVSFFDFIKNVWAYLPTYDCWGWTLAQLESGGSIATIASTGLGYGQIGDYNSDGIPDCIQYVEGWIDGRFAHAYGVQGKDILGETTGTALTDYMNTFPCRTDQGDCKTVEEWTLLGDPSLKIGGYP